jgi:hypothetical protein
MERLTAALEANTAAIEKMIEMSGGKTTASKPAGGKATGSKPTGKPAGKKKTTVDDIAEAFGAYLGVKDADERKERKANVKAIIDHYGVAKATEIDESDFDEALVFLQNYVDGEEPDFGEGGGGEDEDALV